MRRATVILVLCILAWVSAGFVKPAFCHPAEVRDVVSTDVEGAMHLDITVFHNIETSTHYVDFIEVTWGTNITSLNIGPQTLAADGTFTVDYNMGPGSGTATISVRARCSITGYSGAIAWTGTIQTPTPTLTPTSSPSLSPSPTATPSPTSTATASPKPTPSIPEFPSFVILSSLIAATLIGASVFKRKQPVKVL